MRTTVILNPNAGSAAQNDDLRAMLGSLERVDVLVTEQAGDGETFARKVCQDGCQYLVAAGGDGTVNEVLNGMADYLDRVRLGVLPLGTGNDSARTLGLPDNPERVLEHLLAEPTTRRIDLIEVQQSGRRRLALNHVNAGYSNLITDEITADMKQRWGPLAYLKSAASQLGDRQNYETQVRCNDQNIDHLEAVNVLVVNGRTVAGGLQVAPQASLEDGAVEVIIIQAATLVDFAGMAARVLVGGLLDSDHVVAKSATTLHLNSSPSMAVSVDGESFGDARVDIRVLSGVLEVVVGPDYVVNPVVDDADQDADVDAGRD